MTIGAYDGVHLGHRALLAELRARAATEGLATAVVTFDRHPATVVRPESAPCQLCDLRPEARAARGGRRGPHGGGPLRRRAGQRERRGLRHRGAGDRARRPAGGGGGGLPLRPRPQGERRPPRATWGPPTGSRWRGSPSMPSRDRPGCGRAHLVHPDPEPGRGRRRRVRRRPARPAPPGPRPGRPRRPPGGRRSRVSRRPTWPCPTASACRRRVSTPGGTSGPTARCGSRPSRSGAARPSTAVDGDLLVEAFLLDFSGDLYGEEARLTFVARLRDEVAFDSVAGPRRPDGTRRRRRHGTGWPPKVEHGRRLRPVRASIELAPELALQHLAGRVARERVGPEPEPRRHAEGGQPFADEAGQLVAGHLLAGVEHDDGARPPR